MKEIFSGKIKENIENSLPQSGKKIFQNNLNVQEGFRADFNTSER